MRKVRLVEELENNKLLYEDLEYPSDAPRQMGGKLTRTSDQCFVLGIAQAKYLGYPLPGNQNE